MTPDLFVGYGVLQALSIAAYLLLDNLSFKRPWESYYEVRAAFADVKGATPGMRTKMPCAISASSRRLA